MNYSTTVYLLNIGLSLFIGIVSISVSIYRTPNTQMPHNVTFSKHGEFFLHRMWRSSNMK